MKYIEKKPLKNVLTKRYTLTYFKYILVGWFYFENLFWSDFFLILNVIYKFSKF